MSVDRLAPERKSPIEVERLRLLVLHYLEKQPMHGYGLMKSIGELFGVNSPSPGSLYPLLKVMREEGLIKVIEESRGKGRKAVRVYSLTERGKEYLKKHMDELRDVLLKASAVRQFTELGGMELMKCLGTIMRSLSTLSDEQKEILSEALAECSEILRKAMKESGLKCE